MWSNQISSLNPVPTIVCTPVVCVLTQRSFPQMWALRDNTNNGCEAWLPDTQPVEKKPLFCTRRFRLVSTWRRFLQKRSRLPSEYDSKCHVYFSILGHANCEETKRIIKLPKRKEIRTISSTRLILCTKKLSKTSTRHKSRMAATNHYWPLLIYNHEEREMFEVWHYATNTTTLIADEGGIA